MKQTTLASVLTALLAAGSVPAMADPGPHGSPPGVPSAEALALIDNLDTKQQTEIRKILTERRNAEEALRSRMHGEREALARRERTEREQLDANTSQRLREALGEEGFRHYARWATNSRPPISRGGRGPSSSDAPAPPPPPGSARPR